MPRERLNPHLSTDCVIFAFHDSSLNVLLAPRENPDSPEAAMPSGRYKLPGNLIHNNEDLDASAARILFELTGLKSVYLKPFRVFGDPDRIQKNKDDLTWLSRTSGLKINRVVTIAYYSLVTIGAPGLNLTPSHGANWFSLTDLPDLCFDHAEIIAGALQHLQREIRFEPVVFELLPRKFTLRQLQSAYEAIENRPLDNRNFRKKVAKWPFVLPLAERQQRVRHKPAQLFRFDRKRYDKICHDLGVMTV